MEIVGPDDDPAEPGRLQASAENDDLKCRTLSYIHAARANLDAAEDHIGNTDPRRGGAFRIAAALALAIAESNCFDAAETLAEATKYKIHGHHIPNHNGG